MFKRDERTSWARVIVFALVTGASIWALRVATFTNGSRAFDAGLQQGRMEGLAKCRQRTGGNQLEVVLEDTAPRYRDSAE